MVWLTDILNLLQAKYFKINKSQINKYNSQSFSQTKKKLFGRKL